MTARLPPFWSLSTKRIKLVVTYDGTDFSGWAAQPGQRTVQCTLKDAVRQISGEANEITGASRTDSGAHAIGQVCHFDTSNPMPPQNWVRALNSLLPIDLSVVRSQAVSPHFHSRFWAQSRFYRYRLRTGPADATQSRYVHDIWQELDIEAMQRAGSALVGSHNFWAYSEEVPLGVNAIREVFDVQVRPVGREVWIEIKGNAFMKGMMRRISGALFEVGRGRRPVEEVKMLLDPDQRTKLERPIVLPAKGLCLRKVAYGRHPRDLRDKYQPKGEEPTENETTNGNE